MQGFIRSLLGSFCLVCSFRVAHAILRGVAPDDQAAYSTTTFKCKDGIGNIPAQAINDDFCDCTDGSDEPGTGACAGHDRTLFHCANEGATPKLIYASHVDDGVCDCCDGTDEVGLARKWSAISCPNSCAEEGRRDAETRQAALTLHREGLVKKAELVAGIRSDKTRWNEELKVLHAELSGLQAAVATAKAAEANNGTCDDVRAEVVALNATVAGLRDEVQRLKARLATLEGTGGDVQGEITDGAAAGEAVVSEYAKWMDGADSTLGKTEDPVEDADAKSGLLEEDDEDEDPGPIRDVSTKSGGVSAQAAKSGTSSAVMEAEKKVKDNKDAIRKLQKKLDHLEAEEHLPFASLYGKCISRRDAEYTYKLCFFTEAKQDHVVLGRWSGWTGPKEALFDDGHTCYAGPERKLRVIFECGIEAEILNIGEPSRCSYEAHVKHPGACTEEDIALLERPPVKHPKDEL